jgi:Leucine-rich repeat (LRR) protein
MSILNSSRNILDLDLSFNYLSYASLYTLKNIQTIKLVKVKFFEKKNFFETFLNENLRDLDFSQYDLSDIFIKFSILKNLETLILSKVNLKAMGQIRFSNFRKLKKLDLSYNNLTNLFYVSFQYLTFLEYLDLSFNQIEFIDGRTIPLIQKFIREHCS